jgi:hypothetical protein
MSVGDAMTLAVAAIIVVLGGRAVFQQTWDSWIRPMVSSVFPKPRPEIMSHREVAVSSDTVSPRTDAPADGRTDPQPIALKPATLDICKDLRAHGYNRDQARAFLRMVDRSLGNDTWAAAAPDEQVTVTPIVGRPTRAVFREEGPLRYEDPPQ